MLAFEEAYDIVIKSGFRTGTEIIPLTESLDRILAADVVSDIDMPPFDKSSVDGFACRKSDLDSDLEIIETIAAGAWPVKTINPGFCSRIMTGAPVPSGADCVVMVEDTRILDSGKIRVRDASEKRNFALKGEDIRKGDVVLRAGKKINPQDIAVMAAVGNVSVTVNMMPKVAVISTGSELVEPSVFPGLSQIRNTNALQLMAQITRAGASGNYFGIAPDDFEQTFSMVSEAISESDVVLITGGVSMGDFDFVPSVLEKAGVKILFTRIAVQPGKPTTFGIHPKAVIFGLPGNPVSSFIQFELLIRPLLSKMMGFDWNPLSRNFEMNEEFTRRNTDRMALIPVKIIEGEKVYPVEFHGSAHISALSDANGIIVMPIGKNKLKKGEIVSVRQI